jgi:hypothetical protein
MGAKQGLKLRRYDSIPAPIPMNIEAVGFNVFIVNLEGISAGITVENNGYALRFVVQHLVQRLHDAGFLPVVEFLSYYSIAVVFGHPVRFDFDTVDLLAQGQGVKAIEVENTVKLQTVPHDVLALLLLLIHDVISY